MSFLKQIVETLKLELGFIKVHALDPSFPNFDVREEQTVVEPRLSSAALTCQVKQLSFHTSVRVVSHLIEPSSVKVMDGTFKTKEPLTEEMRFEETSSKVHSATLKALVSFQKLVMRFELNVRKVLFKVSVHSRNVPLLRTVRFRPSSMNEEQKNRVLKAIQNFLAQEKIDSFKFIGFYRNVPSDCAKRMIVLDRHLIVELREGAKGAKKDIAVLLTEEGYVFLSVL
uniref:Uncharacterized protein n=1 Tax=Pseudothermotoga hypogea TaxID=57487 RepID=A0A832I8Z0_9THEM